MTDIGHNSVEGGQLRAFIDRIEKLEEEKKAIADDIKDVYAEAKGSGYDVKIMRKIVAMRKQDAARRREEEEILELYMNALGMLADTPLGEAAMLAAKLRSMGASMGANVSVHLATR
jgi:uncharacterized protein (UPF0335 family)